ncbi:hypothetical protein MalM25_26190 [Planctomycetes bacterium MalM25]|nr:hypothetical protein MalM25_26190 [Planctomycetes bacterium MalM25]
MSQKFISLDDAATRLGLTKERLNHLREAGDLRAYRDGASWKFRTEEIEKLEAEGVPSEGDDDLALGGESDLALAMPGDDGPPTPEPAAASAGDDLELDDDMIDLSIEPLGDGDDAESILLTGDQELEGGMPHPQSTIIGKSELSLEDDLELAAASDVVGSDPPEAPAAGGSFDNIEELELDLDGEASKVSNAGDAAATSDLELEDLELDLSGSNAGSDILGGGEDNGSNPSLSGVSNVSGLSGLDAIDLAADEDDDLVLGGSDDSGGDLASSDSGINLSPSDSGFALDEVALDLGGGSAIGSQLDLAALSAAGSSPSNAGSASSGLGGEDFQLTPSDDSDDDEEDSSQIVALEEISEEEEDLPGFESVDDDDAAGGFDDGFSGGGLGGEAAAAPVAVAAAEEVSFPGWIVGILGASMLTMLLCGLMAMDLIQSMWAWDQPFSFNSALIESLAGIFGG